MLLTGSFVLGQMSSDSNISISALGDLSISSQDTAFRSHGLEIVIMGKITPKVMVMAYIANHAGGEGAIAKEYYANFNNPSKLISNYKIGYFRPNFGIINKQHEHTYNFMKTPKSISSLFGNHGWASLGISTKTQLPLKWDNYINFSILQNSFGENISSSLHNHNQAVTVIDTINGFSYTSRFNQSVSINDNAKISLGINYLNGRDKESKSIDLMLKSNTNKYQYYLIQSEYYVSRISAKNHDIAFHPDEELVSAYVLAGRQFNQHYHFGFIFDYQSYSLKDTKSNTFGFYGAIAPFDDSLVFRIKLMNDSNMQNQNYFTLSAVWSLGPHKPQRY